MYVVTCNKGVCIGWCRQQLLRDLSRATAIGLGALLHLFAQLAKVGRLVFIRGLATQAVAHLEHSQWDHSR